MNALDLQAAVSPTAYEGKLLSALAAAPGTVVSSESLLAAIYADRDPAGIPESNVVQVLVGRLRKRMAAANCGWEIVVARGAGYVLRKLPEATEGGAP